MISIIDKPWITFALFTYNQESYIEEAIESVVFQEYDKINIIISDDCSTDRTYDLAREVVEKYRNRRPILLRKNQINQGVAEHVNVVMRLVQTDFVVFGSGDDISMPDRVTEQVGKWKDCNYSECSIFSNAIIIDQFGNAKGPFFKSNIADQHISTYLKTGKCWVGGFSQAHHMNVFREFGSLPRNTFQEDGVLAFRAILRGGVRYIDKELIRYRRHDSNLFDTQTKRGLLKLNLSSYELSLQKKRDIKNDNSTCGIIRTLLYIRIYNEILNCYIKKSIPWVTVLIFEAKNAVKKVLNEFGIDIK